MIKDITPVKLKFSEYKKVQSLLKEDFAENEIKPYAAIAYYMLRGEYSGFALYDGDEIAAYALFFDDKKHGNCLLDYLAVRGKWRSGGIGGRFLEKLCTLKPGMILESEDPDYAHDEAERTICQRRLGFYSRAGFVQSGIKCCLFGVNYLILERGDANANCTASSVTGLYKSMFGKKGYKRYVTIH